MARSMATELGYSILDRMRIDRNGVKHGDYNTTLQADGCKPPAQGEPLAQQALQAWCRDLHDEIGVTAIGTVDCRTHTANCWVAISYQRHVREPVAGQNSRDTITVEAML